MTTVLVRDLALEHWPSMDRYAEALASRISGAVVPDEWRMGGPRYVARYWRYPRALRRYRGDVVHVLDHSYAHCLRAFPGVPSVVTVHDLHPLRVLAEGDRGPKGLVRNWLLRRVLGWVVGADRIIVSTGFTAHELELHLGVSPDRIRVVPYGVDPGFFRHPGEAAVAERRAGWARALGRDGGPAHIVLHVGNCTPRKNVEAAIEAVGLLRARGLDAALVQIGGTLSPRQQRAVRAAGIERRVVQEPAVSEDALVAAYHSADVLVLPSTFEGFGLPAVEAMAAGLPVVTSGAGGLREAVGDGAVVTGSLGGGPLAEALAALFGDTARRADLIAKGRARATTLTWDAVADATRAVHDEVRLARPTLGRRA